MNGKKKKKYFIFEQPFLSEKKFIAVKIRMIMGLLVLVTTFILTIYFYYWHSLAWYFQLIAGFIVLSLAPSIEDFKFLAMSYASYKEEWNTYHESKNKS